MQSSRDALLLTCGAALGASALYLLHGRVSAAVAGERQDTGAAPRLRDDTNIAPSPACSVCCCASASEGPLKQLRLTAPDPYATAPRKGYLCWDDYFMAVAFLSAQRSKDPKKQVGACIVDANKVVVGIGYNGFPRGCPDDALPWAKLSASGNVLETKVPYVVHAEANAILNTNARSLHGAHLYVTMYPCCECAKLIIQSGIRRVTFYEAKSTEDSGSKDVLYKAAARMLSLAGLEVQQHRAEKPLHLSLFTRSAADSEALEVQSTPLGDGRRRDEDTEL